MDTENCIAKASISRLLEMDTENCITPLLNVSLSMDTENCLTPRIRSKEPFKSPLILNSISGFALVFFAFSVSTGILFLPEKSLITSDRNFHYLLLSMSCFTFFLGATLSPLLLTMNFTKPLGRISARSIQQLAIATLIASFITLILAIPRLFIALTDLNEVTHGKMGGAIQAGLICSFVAELYKLISEKFTSCHYEKSLNVAIFALSSAFVGLYTGPLYYLPATIPHSSILYQTDSLYQFALLPVTFLLGTILLIIGVVPAAGLRLPFGYFISKKGLTVSTLAVGLTTLLIRALSLISEFHVNSAMPGGFGFGVPAEQ